MFTSSEIEASRQEEIAEKTAHYSSDRAQRMNHRGRTDWTVFRVILKETDGTDAGVEGN